MLGFRSVCRWGVRNTIEPGICNLVSVTTTKKEPLGSLTCKQMATLTREPKVVLTARDESPMSLKSLEKD